MNFDRGERFDIECGCVPKPWIAFEMAGQARAILFPNFVMSEFVLIFDALDPQERKRAENRDRLKEAVAPKVTHFQRRPREHDRDAGGDQHRRIECADGNIQQTVRPILRIRADPQQNV